MLISKLIKTVNEYFAFRDLTEPDFKESCKFVMTEAGELLNASTKLEDKWLRNNPLGADEAMQQFRYEVGDALMMLVKAYEKARFGDAYLLLRNEDANECMIEELLSHLIVDCGHLYWYSARGASKEGVLLECLDDLINIASYYDLNPYECMMEKFASKGFTVATAQP